MKNLLAFGLLFFAFSSANLVYAESEQITGDELTKIEQRVNSMDYTQLNERKAYLIEEKNNVDLNTAGGRAMFAKISAELNVIQKALIAIAGVGAIAAITDEGYDDNVPPVITIAGSNPATVELGDTYVDGGATAFDEFHGETSVTSSSDVDTSTVGSYTVSYSATDKDGNTATASRVVNVVDTTAPVVTVTGDNPVTVELGSTYTDAGATATDASGSATVVTSGTVDTSAVGTYTLTYTATDASSNSVTATRTVNVVDTTAPVITLNGASSLDVELGASYADAGATASDISGPVTVVTTGQLNDQTWFPNIVGAYTVTYTATDASGNVGTATRTVNMVDTTAPVVTINGANNINVELGASYADAGATASDISGPITVVTTGQLNDETFFPNIVGAYTLTYTGTDGSGNAGTATRTVNMVDTTAPVFTSSSTFTAAENQTSIGTVTASDIAGAVTFTISATAGDFVSLEITSAGVLSFSAALIMKLAILSFLQQ